MLPQHTRSLDLLEEEETWQGVEIAKMCAPEGATSISFFGGLERRTDSSQMDADLADACVQKTPSPARTRIDCSPELQMRIPAPQSGHVSTVSF